MAHRPSPPASGPSALSWLPAALRTRSRRRELKAGEALFRQGDASFGIFELEHGRVRMVRVTADSRPVVLHNARPGEMFAEAALFSDVYHCDAVAADDARVRIYPKREMLAAFRRDPELSQRFMAQLARQVMALRSRLEERNIRSARERVLHHLALAAAPDGHIPVNGTLMDLAAEIGLTHEALYRTLASLEKQKLIARTAGGIALRRKRAV